MWPEASKPVNVPAVKRLWGIMHYASENPTANKNDTNKDRIQFQPAGAPVPLSTSNQYNEMKLFYDRTYKSL